jgi:uncharacterized protein (TIGR00369 family)
MSGQPQAAAASANGSLKAPLAGYGVVSPETLKGTPGLELLRGMIEGRFPAPPIAETLDFAVTEIDPGRVAFVGRPSKKHYNPSGTVHGGYAATLLDSAMGCAVHTQLRPGQGFTTLEIKVNYVRPMFDNIGEIRCEATVINLGKTVATAEGKVLDARGRLIAHGTTTCLIFDI